MFKVLMFSANFYGRNNKVDWLFATISFTDWGSENVNFLSQMVTLSGVNVWAHILLECKYNSVVWSCRLELFFSPAIQISTISSRAFGQLFKIYQPNGK